MSTSPALPFRCRDLRPQPLFDPRERGGCDSACRRARELDPDVEVIWIDPGLADTATFCGRYGYAIEESGNCILLRSKTGT